MLKYLTLIIVFVSGCQLAAVNHQSYEQQRNRDLMMQQGTTGCTPNFSTGACR